MNISATITGDCKYMSLVVSGAQGPATVTVANGTDSHDVNLTLPAGNAAINQVIYLNSTVGTNDGIFEIDGSDSSGDVAYAGAFGKCSLDCCIAKKVDSLLGCDCGCTKCNNTLIQAERVHLLSLGIETELRFVGGDNALNVAIFERAKMKYKKALELCSDSCGCNC